MKKRCRKFTAEECKWLLEYKGNTRPKDFYSRFGYKRTQKQLGQKIYYLRHPEKQIEDTEKRLVQRKEMRELADLIKSETGCYFCEETESIVLDFHHINPETKSFTIGEYTKSEDLMLEEISKCIVVCSNCHRKLHGGLLQYKGKHK